DITLSGNTMSLTISNPHPYGLYIGSVYVAWDHDKGHQTGNDKTLNLLSATLGTQFWSGNLNAPSYTIVPDGILTLPPGSSTLVFTFHQSYHQNSDRSEHITIHFSSPGCQQNVIDVGRS